MSRKMSYSELPAYLKRMVDRTRPVADGYLEKASKGRFRRIKEVTIALQDLSADTGISYRALCEVCDYLVMGCEYSFDDAICLLETILHSGKEQC